MRTGSLASTENILNLDTFKISGQGMDFIPGDSQWLPMYSAHRGGRFNIFKAFSLSSVKGKSPWKNVSVRLHDFNAFI
jgi:hypothetical protein